MVIYGIIIIIMSLITFILYAVDKKKATNNQRRISEKRLLLHSFFFGALGGLIAMYTFRHKTRLEHWYFTFINIFSLALHVVIAWIIWDKFGITVFK